MLGRAFLCRTGHFCVKPDFFVSNHAFCCRTGLFVSNKCYNVPQNMSNAWKINICWKTFFCIMFGLLFYMHIVARYSSLESGDTSSNSWPIPDNRCLSYKGWFMQSFNLMKLFQVIYYLSQQSDRNPVLVYERCSRVQSVYCKRCENGNFIKSGIESKYNKWDGDRGEPAQADKVVLIDNGSCCLLLGRKYTV